MFSGFIPGLKNKSGQRTEKYGGGNSACGSLEAAGENSQKSAFIYGFPDTFGQRVDKASQRYRGTCSAKSTWY